MMAQNNVDGWDLCSNTCKGTGMTLDPEPEMPEGSRIGVLLDLDNGGILTMYLNNGGILTMYLDNGGILTMYLDNTPCGTIAAGLAGPLLPCISSYDAGNVIKIHGGLAPPQ